MTWQPGDIFYQKIDTNEGIYGDCYRTREEAEADPAGAPVVALRVSCVDEDGDIDGFTSVCERCGGDHDGKC